MKDELNLHKRKGKIEIDINSLRKMKPLQIKNFFSVFYPIRIDNAFDFNTYNSMYYGYSEHFDIVEEGAIIPEYEVIFKDYKIEMKKL